MSFTNEQTGDYLFVDVWKVPDNTFTFWQYQ